MYPIETLGVNPYLAAAMLILAYLIGSVSPSTLIAKAKGVDIKSEGSGNAGTTNALRVLGKKAAVATLLIDILKGTLAVVLCNVICNHTIAMFAVFAVILGHVFPIFFKFKGGKGVATTFGALVGLNPLLGFAALAIVVIVTIISKRMSVGSIVGAFLFPILAYYLEPGFIFLGTILALFVIFNHRANIKRLVKGEEPKLNFKK